MLKEMHVCGGKIADGKDQTCRISVYVDPDEAEKRILIEEAQIDEHTLNFSFGPNGPARMEFEPRHTAVITKRPKRNSAADNFLFNIFPIGMFLFKDHPVVVLSIFVILIS